ncbi:MAG: metallophosphoesterase family protein [Planctomycetota bacterium]|jgi:predicted phosphodiesterase|nr:metallophosphoesterase family protein [Planctomycetota bacterium]
MIALISDIHANLPALEAVLADIDSVGEVERIYCLGDVIGYGPYPVECLELTAQRCSLILLGNHEHAVLHGPYLFNPRARRAIEWTKEAIADQTRPMRRKQLTDLLENLPMRHSIDDVLLVHGSPRDPVMEYVLESDLWEGADPSKMDEIFDGFERLCFVGHSHRPGIFTQDRCFLPAGDLHDGYDVSDGNKYLINVGSVGQPRDRDPRSCYVLYTGDAVYFRRVEYDVEQVAGAIRANEALGDHLADRLYKGE